MAWKRNRAALLLLALLPFEAVEPHMGTLFRITLYAPDPSTAREAFTAAFRRVHELDEILSDYDPQSELMRMCAASSRGPMRVSEELFYVLEESQKLARETNGAFDVTVGPLTRLWRQARKAVRPPPLAEIADALRRCGYQKLVLDPARRTVFLKSPGMQLDLGGIAKGYAADEALRVLRELGFPQALVAASGDLAFGDAPPGRDGWRIGAGSTDRVQVLKNAAVSTSGDSEQFLEWDGRRYSHIIDPRTGMGLTASISVTVVAPKGITADGLATAVSVLGAVKGVELIQRYAGTTAFIVTPHGGP